MAQRQNVQRDSAKVSEPIRRQALAPLAGQPHQLVDVGENLTPFDDRLIRAV